MLKQKCYYCNELTGEYVKTTFREMKEFEKNDNTEFLRRKVNLFWHANDRIPMVLVSKGPYVGFRRKGHVGNGALVHARSVNESATHYGNKDALSELKELKIVVYGKEVMLYIDEVKVEESVECNGREYEIDLYLKLSRTEPAEYYDRWGGVLWLEIYHTCKVDRQQAEDFQIERKTLYEYKVPEDCNFYEHLSEEKYNLRKKTLQEKYRKYGIKGQLICEDYDHPLAEWKRSAKGNMTTQINGAYYTVVKNYDGSYAIIYGKNIVKRTYNGKIFETETIAMKVAEHFAFLIYNDYDIKKMT